MSLVCVLSGNRYDEYMIELFPVREIFISIGTFDVRWYGVMYVVALFLVWFSIPRLQKYRGLSLSSDDLLYLIAWGAIGALVGGRFGYVLLYEPVYFFQNPLDVFMLWGGGMSSHGGFVGVGLSLWFVSRKLRVDLFSLVDVVLVPAIFGLVLGRIGNVINGELFGSALVQVFAVLKNIVVLGVCAFVLVRFRRSGMVLVSFLVVYGVLRFLIEFVRVQEWDLVFGLTRGQVLTLPIIVFGGLLYVWLKKQEKKA